MEANDEEEGGINKVELTWVLGIGSLKASNQSLLAKWWWRFRNQDTAIWCKVICSIHGDSGGILSPKSHKHLSGTWSQIIKLKDDLSTININLPMLFKKKIGNGQATSFWHDNWLGGSTLTKHSRACIGWS
ncbi:RNA-directed DNA polymerase, eukaryota, Reverse transcriptase zinc-binding domain protein [Artemisia annua]|uniref:RNA-directed DNA polymerase, eukaryota, Reverse transcriptase zinc-binding domain protein n=1 Tax=Artemisia annua TaxID=35608 RepID=A0A2U1PJ73_ARTAN|nr:RNA-directed DNA polymerase, eukaryota, Reverse transcriptase zinc-binding domain protein [Artemisia annua]